MRRSRRGLFAAAVAALAASGGAGAGCADLPEIGDNLCGNSIVEASEDCDTFAPAGLRCRAAGSSGQCRWDCTAAEDGTRPSCPSGSGCGADGICRTPTGSFAQAGEPIPAHGFAANDFDGDLRTDLVSFDGTDVAVRFYDPDGSVSKTHAFSASIEDRPPAFGDLTGDGKSDAVIHLADIGLGVLTASSDRTLSPVVQASIEVPLPDDGSRLIAADVLVDRPGDETMALLALPAGGHGVLALNQEENNGNPTLLFPLPESLNPLDIAGEIPSGDFDANPAKPCPELVIGFRGDNRVRVYTPCADASSYPPQVVPRIVALPPNHVVDGALFVGDTNGDEKLDILIPVAGGDLGPALDVAFGVGDGSFHSDPTGIPEPGPGDDTAALMLTLLPGVESSSVASGPGTDPMPGAKDGGLLAVGDLNGDGRVDLVTSGQAYLSGASLATPSWFPQSLGASTSWTVAGIADFNGNGYPDIVGASSDLAGLDFLNGAGGGVFNHFDVPTQRPVSRLALGDFDGDLLIDLAFAEVPSSDGQQTLAFCFGRAFGPPEDPVSAGSLPGIAQLITGDRLLSFLLGGGAPDAMSELAIVSVSGDGESGSLTVVPGSSDRRLQSPYVLFEGEEGSPLSPVVIGVGQFTSGDRLGDLFALGVTIDTIQVEAWLVASEGDGRFGDAVARPLDVGDLGYQAAWATVGDLDGPNTSGESLDEVVMMAARYLSADEQALVVVFRPDGAGSFEIEEHPVPEPLSGFFPIGAVLRLADLDGDGFPELIVRALGGVQSYDGGEPKLSELYVYWNEGGQLDFAHALGVPPIEADFVGSFTTLNVDADPEEELVVTGYSGSYLFDAGGAARTFSSGALLPGVPGGITAVGGDFNGDGVDDIAVGAFESNATTVLFGIPERP